MTTNLDLLKTIYNATISLPIKRRINPNFEKSEIINRYYSNEKPYCNIEKPVASFVYSLAKGNDMKFRYDIVIYKTESSKGFLGFFIKPGRCILRVRIYEPSGFSSNNFKTEYFFDTDVIKTKLLNELFDFLIDRNTELNKIEESEKLEKYVNDLNKSVDKSVTREETLNKILEK